MSGGSGPSGGGACMCAGRAHVGGPPSGTSTAEVSTASATIAPSEPLSVTRTSVTIGRATGAEHRAAQPQRPARNA